MAAWIAYRNMGLQWADLVCWLNHGHKFFYFPYTEPFKFGAETSMTLILTAVVFHLFHTGQKGGKGGWGGVGGLTAPFQIAFQGQSRFLFSPVCGQCDSEASGLKVSWSMILILHRKQADCVLSRCVPDTEISSLSAATKMCLEMADSVIAKFILQIPADSKKSMTHDMHCAKSCRI